MDIFQSSLSYVQFCKIYYWVKYIDFIASLMQGRRRDYNLRHVLFVWLVCTAYHTDWSKKTFLGLQLRELHHQHKGEHISQFFGDASKAFFSIPSPKSSSSHKIELIDSQLISPSLRPIRGGHSHQRKRENLFTSRRPPAMSIIMRMFMPTGLSLLLLQYVCMKLGVCSTELAATWLKIRRKRRKSTFTAGFGGKIWAGLCNIYFLKLMRGTSGKAKILKVNIAFSLPL